MRAAPSTCTSSAENRLPPATCLAHRPNERQRSGMAPVCFQNTYDLSDPACLENEEGGRQELPIEARRELLMHRCFVSYAKGLSDDCFPYKDTLAVRRSGPLWPLDEGQLVRVRDLDTATRGS